MPLRKLKLHLCCRRDPRQRPTGFPVKPFYRKPNILFSLKNLNKWGSYIYGCCLSLYLKIDQKHPKGCHWLFCPSFKEILKLTDVGFVFNKSPLPTTGTWKCPYGHFWNVPLPMGEEKNGEVFQEQNPSCWVSWRWWRGLYTCQSFKRFQEMFPLWEQQLSLGFKTLSSRKQLPTLQNLLGVAESNLWVVCLRQSREGLRAAAAEVNRLKRFYPKSFSLEKKKEGFQSQRHILSALLPEKSVCRGVMLWSYPAYSEVPVLASLSCWAAWVSWNAASGWAVSGSSVHSLSSMSATPLSRSRKPKAKAAFRKRFSSWNKHQCS